MASKFYSLEELKEAIIVDSEGLIYGYVEDIHVAENAASLVAYVVFKVNEPAVDVEKLRSTLAGRAALTGDEPLETLVSLARRENIEIPYILAEKEVRWVKGFVPVGEVRLIDVKQISVDETETKLKVVLLSAPREAIFRGLPTHSTSPTIRAEQVLNKPVVSLSRGILGIAKEIVVGAGMLGFRVYRVRSRRRVVNWIAFTTHVKRLGLREAYEKLVEFRDPYRYSKLDLSVAREVEKMLSDAKEKDRVLGAMQNFIEAEDAGAEYEDVPYSDILKVGEVVITR